MSLRYLSVSQLSEVTGKDRRTITDRLAGVKAHSATGRAQYYDSHEVLPLILAAKTVANIEKKLQVVDLAKSEEQLRKLKLQNERLTGESVPIEDVARTVGREYAFVRSQIRSIPSRMAKPLSMVTDPQEVFNQLRDVVDEALSELVADANYEADRQDIESARAAIEAGQTADAKADPEAQSSGVGGPEEIPQS
jgi:hypothetical protein